VDEAIALEIAEAVYVQDISVDRDQFRTTALHGHRPRAGKRMVDSLTSLARHLHGHGGRKLVVVFDELDHVQNEARNQFLSQLRGLYLAPTTDEEHEQAVHSVVLVGMRGLTQTDGRSWQGSPYNISKDTLSPPMWGVTQIRAL